jgi:hypothetical protein
MPQPAGQDFMYGGQPNQQDYGAAPAIAPQPPPPNPFAGAGAPPVAAATRATLQGAAGVFTVVPGMEMGVGRDASKCAILLTEPRVSGLHATLKLENGTLVVRDERSNNGTLVNGNPAPAGMWTPVPNGSLVRFGPVELSVRLD